MSPAGRPTPPAGAPGDERLKNEWAEFERWALCTNEAYISDGMLWFHSPAAAMFSAWLAARGLTHEGLPLEVKCAEKLLAELDKIRNRVEA